LKEEVFRQLLQSAEEALAHARGKRDLRTTTLPASPRPMTAPDVRRLRKRLRASQAVFAHYLNVSPKLVQAWEADRRRPDGPALLLLRLAERHPGLIVGDLARPRTAGMVRGSRAVAV
jgi:putative transcriptional regulator